MTPTRTTSSAGATGRIMVVNDTPGEECRIAILDQGKLDGLFTERVATATNVGNIYKGKVANVEPAIQAAFVDFGEGQSGFLHVSDLHPRYFPSGDKTEKVGKKVPRRNRPLMQEALKRGSEILVQVLKEGIGTKGPTLTSYLSIPGRLLVMMPGMDRVGVSRKVEDEAQRREMRKILDTLDLPEGFGFILRTAGFTATKTDLGRDAAYLTRLWKVMERRMEAVGAPCELYTESDLLLRSLRDLLDSSIEAVVVDSESALQRATQFLGVIAPRSSPPVRYYDGKAPIFHAFDVERQIELIHAREVPLPSGGALVFDQTEALVAIDVNSGRSRSARDSETNAFQTNCEAVEEICRQLRLRDLGGLVIGDLIDMRSAKHRKEIEERFNHHFRRDRARTTVLPISDFGLVQITRQRMRPSLRKTHYMDCPTCAGHGELRLPESLASDALRRVGALLTYERIRRVELVVPVRVAASLLGARRTQLVRLERLFGKRIDVRISEAIGLDRFDVYAYDERNADVEIEKLPPLKLPEIATLPTAATAPEAETTEDEPATGGRGKRRRRRKPGPADAAAIALAGGFEPEPIDEDEVEELPDEEAADAADALGEPDAASEGGRRRKRRRRRRGKGGAETAATDGEPDAPALEAPELPPPQPTITSTLPPELLEGVGPIRVHLFAKAAGLSSRELIDRCAAEGIEGVRSAMSSLAGPTLDQVRAWFEVVVQPTPPSPPAPPSAPATAGEDGLAGSGERRKRRRRRKRRGGDGEGPTALATGEGASTDGAAESAHPDEDEAPAHPIVEVSIDTEGADRDGTARKKRRRRRRRGGSKEDGTSASPANAADPAAAGAPRTAASSSASATAVDATTPAVPAPRPRSLYAGGRTKKISAPRLDDDR